MRADTPGAGAALIFCQCLLKVHKHTHKQHNQNHWANQHKNKRSQIKTESQLFSIITIFLYFYNEAYFCCSGSSRCHWRPRVYPHIPSTGRGLCLHRRLQAGQLGVHSSQSMVVELLTIMTHVFYVIFYQIMHFHVTYCETTWSHYFRS